MQAERRVRLLAAEVQQLERGVLELLLRLDQLAEGREEVPSLLV